MKLIFMAREVAPFNITVNAVGPTPVFTDLIKNVPKAKMQALSSISYIATLSQHSPSAKPVMV